MKSTAQHHETQYFQNALNFVMIILALLLLVVAYLNEFFVSPQTIQKALFTDAPVEFTQGFQQGAGE